MEPVLDRSTLLVDSFAIEPPREARIGPPGLPASRKAVLLFVIIGTGRCGTTLLQRMMNLHPQLFVFPESHWIPKMFEQFGETKVDSTRLLQILARTRHVTGRPTLTCRDADLLPLRMLGEVTVAEFGDQLGSLLAAREGKSLWADKTPDYGYFMTCLQQIWPRCKFLHLIRDGAPVVDSMSRHPGYQALARAGQLFWPPMSFDFRPRSIRHGRTPTEAFVHLWYHRMLRTLDEASRLAIGSYLEVRYEALVDRPVEVLEEICAFTELDAPWPWLERAGALINRDLSDRARPTAALRHFGMQHKELLKRLGYRS